MLGLTVIPLYDEHQTFIHIIDYLLYLTFISLHRLTSVHYSTPTLYLTPSFIPGNPVFVWLEQQLNPSQFPALTVCVLLTAIEASIIARGTVGFSGADLENLVNQAALKAAVDGKDMVTMKELEFAKDKILMGE